MSNDFHILADCVEAVYNEIDPNDTSVPLHKLKNIINAKTKPKDFEILKNIAKGGYGEVFLVKLDNIYAMKRVPKDLVLKQPNTALFMAEKDVLVDSIGSEWLVSARITLQDEEYLYYLMDFIPGGDFMGLLSKEDVLEENWVKFYVVEIIAALDELHKLNWIHRDLKPDNILIGLDGHIKLADFGSCIKMIDGKARSSITVGTPDYVSPDILNSSSIENEYGENVDFWTLGVIIYEMLYGTTPFYSSTLIETYKKITNIEYIFPFNISDELKDLIKKLICRKEERLDISGIKSHSFFKDIDWENVKQMKPPFVPSVKGELDTSNFIDTHFEAESRTMRKKGCYFPFVGFTHDPNLEKYLQSIIFCDVKRPSVNGNSLETNTLASKEYINTVNKLEDQIKEKSNVLKELELQIDYCLIQHNNKREEYKILMLDVLSEREELEFVKKELLKKKADLNFVLEEFKDKKIFYDDFMKNMVGRDTKTGFRIQDKDIVQIDFNKVTNTNFKDNFDKIMLYIEDIRRNYDICSDNVNKLQNKVSVLLSNNLNLIKVLKKYKGTNIELASKVQMLEIENSKFKKVGVESLKKQVRILSTEVKEYQQKLDQEIYLRKKLEEELKNTKMEKNNNPKPIMKQEFACKYLDQGNLLQTTVKIIDEYFYLNNIKQHINNVFVQELKNNELHHFSYKNRALTLKIIFVKESVKSISSSGRRNIKSLEEDLRIEESMKQGLESMMSLLDGLNLEEAKKQYNGSLKKISQLKSEIENARRSTLTEEIPEDPVKLYEFNNHLFAVKSFTQGTLCEHCNECLYGTKDQGFECRDCKMIVHKSCYVLGDVSCEMYNAFKRGEIHYLLLRSLEDRERFLSVYKKF